ncbi:MAG: ATP-dependent zinc protease [Nanoarchaeales archaeon]|nr:ATP-dependent zinc protease [Nanoarchaeales archaeon]
MFFKEKRIIIGLIESITLENGVTYKAKIDTGADSSSIDSNLLEKLGEKKIISHRFVKSALGRIKRPKVNLEVEFQSKKFTESFTVADRSHLRYKVLIGKDILKKEGFLIDPNKQND